MPHHRQQGFVATTSHHRRRKLAFVLTGLTCLALLIGLGKTCEEPPPRQKPWREPLPEATALETSQGPTDKQVAPTGLQIHLDADPGGFHPLQNPSVWTLRIVMDTVFETLIRYRPEDKQGEFLPGLAKDWVVSSDGLEIRFTLDERATFSDSVTVKALDVQFSIETALAKSTGAPHQRQPLQDISSVAIVDQHTVRVRLARRNWYVLRHLATLPILPKHIYEKNLSSLDKTWIGSGPYLLRVESSTITLTRRKSYWGKVPDIAEVQFLRERDATIALRKAKEGAIDILPHLIREHYPHELSAPRIKQNFREFELSQGTLPFVAVNHNRPPFDERSVRRALSHLIDFDLLAQDDHGLSVYVPGPIFGGGPGNAPSSRQRLGLYNPKQAATLLQEAGWLDPDGDSVRMKNGTRLMVSVLATTEESELQKHVFSQLRDAGFVLDVRRGSAAVLENRLRSGDFDLAFVTWFGDIDRNLRPLLASKGSYNFGRFKHRAVDTLLTQIEESSSPRDRHKLLLTLDELLRREVPFVVLPVPRSKGLAHKRVTNLLFMNGWLSIRDLELESTAK